VNGSHFVPAVFEFLSTTRKDYLNLPENAAVIVASLVCAQKQAELDTMAGVLQQSVGQIMVEYAAWILARVFRLQNPQQALDFMIGLYDRDNVQTNVKNVMTTCTVKMVNLLVQDLGDRSPVVQAEARQALERAAQVHGDRSAPHRDVGIFLQPHILGVITTLNEDLHGARRKMTLEGKRRVLRALRNLIEVMGDALAPTTPQLIASLQSSLTMPGLAEESLITWCTFMDKLRYSNSGPFVGRTTAAVVANWHLFSATERRQAVKLVQEIANNAVQLKAHLDDVVDMSGIDDLKAQSKTLMEARSDRSFDGLVETLLERTSSGNTAVATTALREFQSLLATHERQFGRLVQGDSFNLLATKIVRGLMVATQEEDSTVRSLAAACLGRLGLLDNDRLAKMVDSGARIMLHNFRNEEEVADFACMFIRDVLVDSYKITNDIKYQGFLAYAMQELLRMCGFRTEIIDQPNRFDTKVQDRWKRLPKYQVEALSPLLHTRFKMSTEGAARVLEMPYYRYASTYREWVQNWSIMLLQRICDFTPDDAPGHARQIFGVLRGVLRNQDVSVALYVLPHMVLHVLLSGDEHDRLAVAHEINTVLKDQVNTSGPADKRALSAQVIFDLMDHLGKWLRRFRHLIDSDRQQKLQQNRHLSNQPEPRTHPHIVTVERVLGSVDTELLANAALQSKAYARSLLNFEQRIIEVHDKCDPRKEPPPLYAYYERLHEIYADLDEPDGMEGVSMYVMAPSLEYQIREHESTGRWTSAQSCWEVRLQQSPDDLALHQGLLRCLRNLGHYDTLRTHIRGVLSRRPDWRTELAPFEAEAAWIVGDWETVKSVADHGYPMADVMLQLHLGQNPQAIKDALEKARIAAGNEITSITYSRATEPILSLHILRELEMIHNGSIAYEAERNGTAPRAPRASKNDQDPPPDALQSLRLSLSDRFETTAPAFRIRETILSARRTAFGTSPTAAMRDEIGKAWILSSKMARKAGYEQTAYSAALQAKEVDAPFAFVQQAKLTKLHGGVWKALEELTKSLDPLIVHAENEGGVADKKDTEKYDRQKSLAKVRPIFRVACRGLCGMLILQAVLLQARWTLETGRLPHNQLIHKFVRAVQLLPEYVFSSCQSRSYR
jgi:serine/threonine-protein kinase ATR